MVRHLGCCELWIFLTSVNNVSPNEVDLFENVFKPQMHTRTHCLALLPQAQRRIGGDSWPFKDYHNIMRETNLMRKPFFHGLDPSSSNTVHPLFHNMDSFTTEGVSALPRPRADRNFHKNCSCKSFLQHVSSLCRSVFLLLFSQLHYYCYNFHLLRFCCRFCSVLLSFVVCVGNADAPR